MFDLFNLVDDVTMSLRIYENPSLLQNSVVFVECAPFTAGVLFLNCTFQLGLRYLLSTTNQDFKMVSQVVAYCERTHRFFLPSIQSLYNSSILKFKKR